MVKQVWGLRSNEHVIYRHLIYRINFTLSVCINLFVPASYSIIALEGIF